MTGKRAVVHCWYKPTDWYARHHACWIHSGSSLLLCAGLLLFAGCTTPTISQHYYALSGAVPATRAGSQKGSHSDKVLRIARISVPPWLAEKDMYYRLAYRKGPRLAAYAYSDWTAPPAKLLASVIRNTLAAGGGWQAVVGPGIPAAGDVSLHLRLENFSQIFVQQDQSAGVIALAATLIDSHARVISQKDFRVRSSAPTPDALGGVKALAKASHELAMRLRHWIRAAMTVEKR